MAERWFKHMAPRDQAAGKSSLSSGAREFAEALLGHRLPRRAAPVAANATEASPPSAASEFAQAILGKSPRADIREFLADVSTLHEGEWDSSKHPRGGFSQNRGWWSPTGGGASTASDAVKQQVIAAWHHAAQLSVQNIAASGAVAPARPSALPWPSPVPMPGTAIRRGIGVSAGIVGGALAGGLRNSAMAGY